MTPDWKVLLKDKRVLLATGGVAVVGLIVYARRQKNGDENADPATADGSTPTRGAAFDTTGTDMSGWISEYTKTVLEAIRLGQQQQPGGGLSPNVPRTPTPRRTMPSPIREPIATPSGRRRT